MVLSDSCPHTIGLFSKWGTGKSSIVDQLKKDLENENRAHLFIFDTWKYQEDSLRRTFLIKLDAFLRTQNYTVPSDALSSFYKKKTSSVASTFHAPKQKTEANGTFAWLQRNWTIVGFITSLGIIAMFYALVAFYPGVKVLAAIKDFLTSVTALGGLVLVLKPVAEKFLEQMVSKIFKSTERYTEIRTQVEEEDRLQSPEQFENVFNILISSVCPCMVI
jgi:hypothetical protein